MKNLQTLLLFVLLLASFFTMSQTYINIRPDDLDGNDAMIWAAPSFGNNFNNYGNSDQLVINAWTNSGEPDTIRVLLELDLSMIPAGSVISDARLSLYNNPMGSSHNGQHQNLDGTNEWSINRITQSWDENSVTWVTKPTYTTSNQVLMAASTNGNQNFLDIDVAEIVQDMIDNPSTSFGFYLMLEDETPYKALVFASSEYEDSHIMRRPMLEITYSSLSIDEYQLMDSRVYPNPASTSMLIEFENAAHASYELSVYDQLGRKIHSASTSQSDITVDLQGFISGFYQYSLFCLANQKRSTGKFVKN